MRLFSCGHCEQRLYFENVSCTRCGATLGFLADRGELVSLDDAGEGLFSPHGEQAGYRMCANHVQHAVCNWMVGADEGHAFCRACRLNRTIPNLGVAGNVDLWRTPEAEKRRPVYALLRLDLPLASALDENGGLGSTSWPTPELPSASAARS